MAGLIWLWQTGGEPPVQPPVQPPVVYGSSSMGRKRREARLARKRKDDEMLMSFVRSFMESLHAPR
jgi:hypothetical protein